MKSIILFILSTLLLSCTSPKLSGITAEKCGLTPIMLSDMETFGFFPVKDKVVVMRIFATWCPYCKDDLTSIGDKFKKGEWKSSDVQIYLMSYKNRRENQKTYTEFIRDTFPKFGIPLDAAQIVFVDKDFNELSKMKNAAGKVMFEGWQGVPFAMIYGKDGRLAFRGHFTQGSPSQESHYSFISGLTKENCGRKP